MTTLFIGATRETDCDGGFSVNNLVGDFSRLGECIWDNTHIAKLELTFLPGISTMNRILGSGFVEGLKRNSSIFSLQLNLLNADSEVEHAIL